MAKRHPVAFCGVNNITTFEYDTSRFKGIKEDIDVKNTLFSIYELQPHVDSLIVISTERYPQNLLINL